MSDTLVDFTSLKHSLGMTTPICLKEHEEIASADHPQINPKQLLVQEDFAAWFWSKQRYLEFLVAAMNLF